jgi:RNA polymerase sigma factor (sigma-70 family)
VGEEVKQERGKLEGASKLTTALIFDSEEVAALYKDFFSKAVGYLIKRFAFQEADAMDIASQAFCEFLGGKGDSYDPQKGASLCTWLIRRASHRAQDFLRRQERQGRMADKVYKLKRHGSNPEEDVLANERTRNREKLISQLPSDLRILCELLIEEYRPHDIAVMLQIPVREIRNAQQRLRRALDRLAQELGLSVDDLIER